MHPLSSYGIFKIVLICPTSKGAVRSVRPLRSLRRQDIAANITQQSLSDSATLRASSFLAFLLNILHPLSSPFYGETKGAALLWTPRQNKPSQERKAEETEEKRSKKHLAGVNPHKVKRRLCLRNLEAQKQKIEVEFP